MASLGHARRHTTFAAITSVAAAALLSPAALMSACVHAGSLPLQVYSTAIGEIRPIVLDRWISLRMNTDTGAVVTAHYGLCDVELNRGEALFEVQRDSPRALRVVAGSMVMSTGAARFSVRVRDSRNVDLLVSKGQVTVGATVIGEHQMARIAPDGLHVRSLQGEDVDRRLAWIRGRIAFAGEPLAEAVEELNRYNDHKLVIQDRAIRLIPIGGQFRVGDLPSFVAALRPLGVRAVGRDGNGIRLVGVQRAD